MSCRSLIYCHNSNNNVETGGTIPVGTIIRRFGKYLNQSGNGILAEESGYFIVNANFTVVPTETGVVEVNGLSNGSIIAISENYADTAEQPINLNLVFVVRNSCCEDTSTVTFKLVSGGGNILASDVVIERL